MAQNQNGMNAFLGNPAMLGASFSQIGLPLSLHHPYQQQSAQHVVQQQIPPMEPFQFLPRPMYENTVLQIAQQYNHQFAQPAPVQQQKIQQKQVDDPENNGSFDMKFLDDIFTQPTSYRTPTKMDPKTKSLCELQRISIQGCEAASRIFQAHSKRPYFKKIDLLCNRLMQDLSNTNKAVININSHGVAWAIKDFIFVFNRITAAWVIMRDYFYSNSEGMQCVKESIDRNFEQEFLIWQEATKNLMKTLVSSYENLHMRDQQNGNRKSAKNDSHINSPSTGPKNDPFQRIFDPLITENSEQMQLSGNYLKSAVYKPLSSSEDSTPPDTPGSNPDHSYESFKLLCNDVLPENVERSGNPKPLYKRTPQSNKHRMKVSLTQKFESMDVNGRDSTELLQGIQPLVDEEDPMTMLFCFDVLKEFYGEEGARKINGLFNSIMKMPESMSFIARKEGLKYADVPNFVSNDEGLSITQVITHIQEGKYKNVCDVFIAVKMVAEYAKALLQFNYTNDGQMKSVIGKFVQGVENALARYA